MLHDESAMVLDQACVENRNLREVAIHVRTDDMERWLVPESQHVVVDDKVCAFLLADYCRWGDHQDGHDPNGRPVYAETTRLFIRARRDHGARREVVEAAQALPSRRNLMIEAPGYFACSGFPRGGEWHGEWGTPEQAVRFMTSPRSWPDLDRLVRSRRRHQLALFRLLPSLCDGEVTMTAKFAAMRADLGASVAHATPGALVIPMLALADDERGPLGEVLEQL